MVSLSLNDTAGFAPLAPPTVWQGWDAFVHRAPAPARDAADPVWSQTEREDYHSELAVMRTPAMDNVFTAVRRLLLVNRRQQAGARRGLIISGPATTGKTTTMMALGRSFQLADARQHPGQAARRPVLFISVPPAATPKMLVSEFARFLNMPITDRLNQTQITGAVCDLLGELGTQLVLVDDVHLLDTQRRAGAETSDQLKYLGERIPATFVYSAIDIETSSLLSGVRGPRSPAGSSFSGTGRWRTRPSRTGPSGTTSCRPWRTCCGCAHTGPEPWSSTPPTCTPAPQAGSAASPTSSVKPP